MKIPASLGLCLGLLLMGSPLSASAVNRVPSPPGHEDTNTGEIAHGGHGGHHGHHHGHHGHHHGHHDGHHRGWHGHGGHWGNHGWYGGRGDQWGWGHRWGWGDGWGGPGWGLGYGANASEEVIDVNPTKVYDYEEMPTPVIVTPPAGTTQYIKSNE